MGEGKLGGMDENAMVLCSRRCLDAEVVFVVCVVACGGYSKLRGLEDYGREM